MSLITYPLNNIEYTAEDAELFNATRKSGIFFKDDFPYTISGEANTIVIGEGLGWIRNDKFKGKVIALKAPEVVALDITDSVFPRIDAVVIKFDVNANATNIVVKKGAPSSTPIPPAVTRNESVYELHLYHIYRNPGSLSISPADVTDLRISSGYCGLMADAITEIDTKAIEDQFNNLVVNLKNAIDNIQNENEIVSYLKRTGSPYNFLDNSDFRNPVNQRGQKSYLGLYSGSNARNYTIDRWLNYWGKLDIYVADGYVRFVNNTSGYVDIEQRFPYGTFDPSKKYTFVKKGADGVVDVRQANISSYPDAGLDVVQTSFAPGETRLLWAALYEGEYDYLNFPEYKPKGYAEELLECRRYYQELDSYAIGAGYSGSGGDVTAFVNTGIQMRAVPSVTYSGSWNARCNGNDYACNFVEVKAFDRGNAATVRLTFRTMSLGNFQTVTVYNTGKVALVADL